MTTIDEIHARLEAATEGPWKIVRHDLSLYVESEDANLQANLGYVGNRPDNDAAFIAEAPTDIAFLLDLARRQQAALDGLIFVADNRADLNKPVGRWWSEVIKGTIKQHMEAEP